MKTDRLITRRRAIVAGLASVGGLVAARYAEGSAADLRQPAAHGRYPHVRGAPRAAARAVAGAGIRIGDLTSFPATGTTNLRSA